MFRHRVYPGGFQAFAPRLVSAENLIPLPKQQFKRSAKADSHRGEPGGGF
jgi:hypothetical protein